VGSSEPGDQGSRRQGSQIADGDHPHGPQTLVRFGAAPPPTACAPAEKPPPDIVLQSPWDEGQIRYTKWGWKAGSLSGISLS
jgi:hypothetical protein